MLKSADADIVLVDINCLTFGDIGKMSIQQHLTANSSKLSNKLKLNYKLFRISN